MRNIIKKGLILLLLSLTPLVSHSQDSIYVSTQQVTAIIFSEHQKLSNENLLLKQQVFSLEELNKLHLKTDSIQRIEVTEFKERVASDKKKIEKLKSTQKKTIIGSSVGGVFLFILGLLL